MLPEEKSWQDFLPPMFCICGIIHSFDFMFPLFLSCFSQCLKISLVDVVSEVNLPRGWAELGGLGLTYIIYCAVLSRSVMSDSLRLHGLKPAKLLCPWGFSRQEYWMGCHALLQGIFPTQGLNPGLPHCRWIQYLRSHQGSPGIMEWVVYPVFKGSSDLGMEWESPALQADSFPAEIPGKPI